MPLSLSLCVYIYIYIHMGLFCYCYFETSITIPPTPICYRTPPPIINGCPPSPLVGSECAIYAYRYMFGACGGQFLGFRNWHGSKKLIGLL